MATVRRGELSEAQWTRLQPLLPPQKAKVGKPAHDHRRILHGILWKLRTSEILKGKTRTFIQDEGIAGTPPA